VPWNNNNAENAIKRFAYYREEVTGVTKERGLHDYLLLLSLYQTCRYKGISFLKFLVSGEQDLDVFSKRTRPKQRLPAIQTHPNGFDFPRCANANQPKPPEKPPDAASESQ
jgi:hypothetical protein